MEGGGGAGEGGLGRIGSGAVPVGDDAAGAANDGDEGGDVPRVHDRIEHDVGPAGGDEEVTVGVAPRAVEFGALREGVVAGRGGGLVFGDVEGVAGEKRGVFEVRGGAAADGTVVEGGGGVVAEDELAEDGLMDRAEDGLALVQERDERGEERDSGDEGFGAVDRIEDPDEFGVGVFGAELFADDAMGGEFFGDAVAKELFGAAVGEGDGGGVGFRFDGESEVAEVRTDEVAAFAGELRKKAAVGREVHGREMRANGGEDTKISRRRNHGSISGVG